MNIRRAHLGDSAAIAAVYNQGIEDRGATFETQLRTAEDIGAWFDGRHPIVVGENGGELIAFAATTSYRLRECYAGIAELSVYVDRRFRRRGIGRMLLAELLREAEELGFWKLVSRVFPENQSSLALVRSLGFREVGLYQKHGCLDGIWRDVIIVERMILTNLK